MRKYRACWLKWQVYLKDDNPICQLQSIYHCVTGFDAEGDTPKNISKRRESINKEW